METTNSDKAKAAAIDLMTAFASKHAPRVEPVNSAFFAELLAMIQAFNDASSLYAQERITSVIDSLKPGKVSGTHTAAGNESTLG